MTSDQSADRTTGERSEPDYVVRRRQFLTRLLSGGAAGFTLLSLGEQARASADDEPSCGTYTPDGSLFYDGDCGVMGANGEPKQDRDCGVGIHAQNNILRSGDNDCAVTNADGSYSSGDNDCGKASQYVGEDLWYHQDNDCHLTGSDLDCGKRSGFDTFHVDNG